MLIDPMGCRYQPSCSCAGSRYFLPRWAKELPPGTPFVRSDILQRFPQFCLKSMTKEKEETKKNDVKEDEVFVCKVTSSEGWWSWKAEWTQGTSPTGLWSLERIHLNLHHPCVWPCFSTSTIDAVPFILAPPTGLNFPMLNLLTLRDTYFCAGKLWSKWSVWKTPKSPALRSEKGSAKIVQHILGGRSHIPRSNEVARRVREHRFIPANSIRGGA